MADTSNTVRGSDRRGTDRRVAEMPFAGDDRRTAERRSGDDRRARSRVKLIG